MKVLHVWNTAAVPSILSKYLRRKGILSDVIMRHRFDKYGFEEVYSDFTGNYNTTSMGFYGVALKKAADYDILHVHAVDKLVPILKISHQKPVILHYHGTDIRNRGKSLLKRIYRRFSDLLFVSTPDLLIDLPSATYLPNPIDTDFFKPVRGTQIENTALFFLKKPDDESDLKIVDDLAKQKDLKLHVYNRVRGGYLPYVKLPDLYNQHEYFIDRIKLKSLSKMGLEALACGLKVIKDGKIISELPEKHRPQVVTEALIAHYKMLDSIV